MEQRCGTVWSSAEHTRADKLLHEFLPIPPACLRTADQSDDVYEPDWRELSVHVRGDVFDLTTPLKTGPSLRIRRWRIRSEQLLDGGRATPAVVYFLFVLTLSLLML